MPDAGRKAAEFPIDIVKNRGIVSLRQIPRICVGTIHSVKGAEADVVYLFPNISKAARAELNGSSSRQAACTAPSTSG